MEYLNAFWVGGLICVIGQLLIDLTKLTPARIMVLFVTSGVALGALGLYAPLVEFAGCGATVPLTGFGWALSEGVRRAVAEEGFSGGVHWQPLTPGPPGQPPPLSLRPAGRPGGQAQGQTVNRKSDYYPFYPKSLKIVKNYY